MWTHRLLGGPYQVHIIWIRPYAFYTGVGVGHSQGQAPASGADLKHTRIAAPGESMPHHSSNSLRVESPCCPLLPLSPGHPKVTCYTSHLKRVCQMGMHSSSYGACGFILESHHDHLSFWVGGRSGEKVWEYPNPSYYADLVCKSSVNNAIQHRRGKQLMKT